NRAVVKKLTCTPIEKTRKRGRAGMHSMGIDVARKGPMFPAPSGSSANPVRGQLSRPFLLASRRANLVFQQPVCGARNLELLKAPFQNQFAEISKRSLLLCS